MSDQHVMVQSENIVPIEKERSFKQCVPSLEIELNVERTMIVKFQVQIKI